MTQPALPPNTRRSPETWAAARADYEAGVSAAVVAERHGIPLRTVRRHALAEGWRHSGRSNRARRLERLRLEIAERPELGAIENLNGEDAYELLFVPNAEGLAGFAFRRAAESAVLGGPAEAAAWLRVVQLCASLGDHHDVDRDPFTPADQMRAELLRIPEESGDEAVDDDAEVAEVAAMAVEKHGHFGPGD